QRVLQFGRQRFTGSADLIIPGRPGDGDARDQHQQQGKAAAFQGSRSGYSMALETSVRPRPSTLTIMAPEGSKSSAVPINIPRVACLNAMELPKDTQRSR